MTNRTRLAVWSAAAVMGAGVLGGCAVVPPPSSLPPTGWPRPAAGETATAWTPSPTPVSPSAAPATVVRASGVTIQIPAGYDDATDLVQDAGSSASVTLLAYLRNNAQHAIWVQRATTDRQDVAAFVDFYTKAQNAGTEQRVTASKPSTVAGLAGTELTLQSTGGDVLTALFIAMPKPGEVLLISGEAPDDSTRTPIEAVARGITRG